MRHPKTLIITMVVGLFAMAQMPLLMAQQDDDAFVQSDEELDQDASDMDEADPADEAWQSEGEAAAENDATGMDEDAPAEGPQEDGEESAEDEFSDLLEPSPPDLDTASADAANATAASENGQAEGQSREEAERKLRELVQKEQSELAELGAELAKAVEKFSKQSTAGELPPTQVVQEQERIRAMHLAIEARSLASNVKLQQMRCDLDGVSNADCNKLIDALKNPPATPLDAYRTDAYRAAIKRVETECRAELHKHCSSIEEPGLRCLKANEATASPACKQAMNDTRLQVK